MKTVPLSFPFFLSLFFTAFGTVFFPQIRLIAFAPFLALLYSRAPFLFSLWISAIAGLCIDLFGSQSRFGLYALNYCLTTFILYKHKRHFFEDKPIALSCFTAIISSLSTLLQLCLSSIFDQAIPFSWKFVSFDLLMMPCIDALFAYVCFFNCMKLYIKVKSIHWQQVFEHLRKLTKLKEEQ
ncbi:MAG: hypothetical protein K2P51_00810 [Rhabdochlamydiaceae bacterium]|nr:hypothetical protein [Rhabdochlamydiaceae bacterium]